MEHHPRRAASVKDDEQDDACDEDEEGDEEMAVGDDGPGLVAEAQSVLHAVTLIWPTLAVTFEQNPKCR